MICAEPHAPNMHVHTPSTANAFSGHNIEDVEVPMQAQMACQHRHVNLAEVK